MGMLNWRKDDDADDDAADADEFDVDDDGSAVADGLDDEWDDGLDDEWGDEFGGEDDALVHDLQDKVNGMETELGGVSSSMKTIKEENKRIAETVDELDDTIRQLLDVYEIVTRGINPFVDDAQAMANMNNEGSFGMFGDVEEQNEDALDPSLAGANAESFFDDDFDDVVPEPEPEPEADVAAAGADVDPADELGADAPDDGAESGGGISFEDLKAEYESADDDLDELDDEAFADAHLDGESTDETVEFDDLDDLDEFDSEGFDDEDFGDEGFDDEDFGDEGFDDEDLEDAYGEIDFDEDELGEFESDDPFDTDDPFEREDGVADDDEELPDPNELLEGAYDSERESGEASTDDAPPAPALATNGSTTHGDEQAASTGVSPVENAQNGGQNVASGHDSNDPDGDYYLGRVPSNYVAELHLMEWAEQLVAVGGTAGAMDACRYYERLGWISPSVSDQLSTHVVGTAVPPDTDRPGTFDVDDHVRSLGYVSRLGGDPSARLVELASPGGEHGGIRG